MFSDTLSDELGSFTVCFEDISPSLRGAPVTMPTAAAADAHGVQA
jgi:hypothetical protein